MLTIDVWATKGSDFDNFFKPSSYLGNPFPSYTYTSTSRRPQSRLCSRTACWRSALWGPPPRRHRSASLGHSPSDRGGCALDDAAEGVEATLVARRHHP